jgi:hypothetical protein
VLEHASAFVRPMSGMPYGGTDLVWMPDKPTSKSAYYGAPQTIQVMSKAALDDQKQFATRHIAESVCEGLDSKDYLSEYLALYYFLMQRTRYMRDPRRTELVRAPYVISEQILAGRRPSIDCDDAAAWLAAAVLAVGGTAWFATVAFQRMIYQGQVQYSHVFTVALEPRTRARIILDPVAAEKTTEMKGRIKAARLWGPLN